MDRRSSRNRLALGALLSTVSLLASPSHSATKNVDLDGNAANGAESQCDLNVLQTFPVKIENRVTNKAVGDAYNFSWKSAGPGGFTSSVTPGSTGGVGAKWVWTTNQTVYSYTGSTCANDLCFLQTAGPDPQSKYCSSSCAADGALLGVAKTGTPGEVLLTWTGGQGPFTVYRSTAPSATVVDPSNAVGTTDLQQFADAAAAGGLTVYVVRGVDCTARKTCASDTDCNPVTEGTCVSRGPFSVPGRSLYSTDVTVSSASLTSSLITFFSPPKEVFRVTSTVAPGGGGVAYQQTLSNPTDQDVVVTVTEYPPGCCSQEHQINCDGECFNYLTDVDNCGGCGVACPAESYCDQGTCSPACSEGQTLCGTSCFDLQTDRQNCGACGNVCQQIIETENCEGSKCIHDQICVEGGCQICPGDTNSACDNACTDIHVDNVNCGGCGHDCNLLCPEGTVSNYCNGGGTCCCVQPEGPEVCVPSSLAPFSGFSSTHQPPRGTVVEEAPLCETPPSQTIIPAGGTSTDCLVSGVLSKEVPTTVVVCGNDIPQGDARCANGDPASEGTFMKLVPDLSKPIGAAYITPYAIHIGGDPSSDGLIEPGEFVGLVVEVVNAGPATIAGAHATIVSTPVDLTDDGVANPVAVTLSEGSVSFGNILGTLPSPDCTTPSVIHPARGSLPFYVTIPANHPSDTSRPLVLQFTGTVDGIPFAQDVPISIGIADKCDYAAGTGDYDGLEALVVPMAALLPVGDTIEFPANPFPVGAVLPLKVRHFCGGATLLVGQVDPPQIVGLSEQAAGPLDITTLGLNNDGDHPNDLLFFWDAGNAKWHFDMNTSNLGPGTYTLTIRIAGRKEYVTGFVLVSD